MISRTLLILSLSLLSGCSQSVSLISAKSSPEPTIASPIVVASAATPSASPTPSPLATRDYFKEASAKAERAARMAQNATSKDDWTLIANLYKQTIDLLKQVPKDNSSYTKAQQKLKEYQANLTAAQSKSNRPTNIIVTPTPPPPPSPSPTQQARNNRSGRSTPHAPVAMSAREFLENVYFRSVVDQGYSGDSYWCASSEILTSSFFAPRSYQILNLLDSPQFADATVRIESSNRGGQPIISDWSFYLKREQTVTERDYRQQHSPVSARAWNQSVGGWCVALINER